MIQQKLS